MPMLERSSLTPHPISRALTGLRESVVLHRGQLHTGCGLFARVREVSLNTFGNNSGFCRARI